MVRMMVVLMENDILAGELLFSRHEVSRRSKIMTIAIILNYDIEKYLFGHIIEPQK